MSDTVWIRHPETGGTAEVPKENLSQYRQSGWDLLSDEAKAEQEQKAADERAEAEQRIQKFAEQALGVESPAAVLSEGDTGTQPENRLPAKNAPKPEWEQAARAAGVPDDEIASSTKDQLVARLTDSKENG